MGPAARTVTAAELAERLGGTLSGEGARPLTGVAALDEATGEQITFIADRAHARLWDRCRAGAAVISRGLEASGHDPATRALIVVPDAELAMADLLAMFEDEPILPELGIHPTAWVHETTTLGRDVRIGPHVSIDREAVLGDGVILHAGVRIYGKVVIGAGSVLHANCVLRQGCRLGRGVILHQGVSIGADGFGYRSAADGSGLVKMPHIGSVVLEDGVEIGANSCVDRGKFGDTVIGAGTKLDNLIQIGHNCRIGRCCVIAGMTAVGGSTVIGDGCQIAGAVGISDHITIGSGAAIGARSVVIRDVPAGETWLGYPADRSFATLRQWATIRKMPRLAQRLESLLEDRSRTPRSRQAPD